MNLSPRQREVLLWTARGKTAPEIAAILGRGPGTVRAHRDLAMIKLGASNVCHAVAKALASGVLNAGEIQ